MGERKLRRTMASECVARSYSSNTTPRPRGADSARVVHDFFAQKNEGAGKAGCAASTRSLVCKMKKHTSIVTTGSPNNSDLPCAMVLTAYNALSPATNSFLSPSSAD
jgi:hypothetical protein